MPRTVNMDLRSYGLGASPKPIGTPTWKRAEPIDGVDPICPNCGAWVCEIEVKVESDLLVGGVGVSRYLGCPACPWASPSVATALPKAVSE